MNYSQLALFLVFVLSNLCLGAWLYLQITGLDKTGMSRQKSLLFGEALLTGSIFTVGAMVLISVMGFYYINVLWAVICLPFLLIFSKSVRTFLDHLRPKGADLTLANAGFTALLVIFFIRNSYFLVDVDSHGCYLFMQKLWLFHHSSIFADPTTDFRIYVPAFDTVPFALGIGLFGQETFFPQLINVFWRIIVLFMVYGYTSYRFNSFYGLAAAMLVAFNDHFFISGGNQWVLINGAIIAFIFASAYNFLEARRQMSPNRWLLAMIFLSQLLANKYQALYILVGLTVIGFLIQDQRVKLFKKAFANKKGTMLFGLAWALTLLWFIKNYMATGLASYPILAGKFGVMGWTPEMEHAFMGVFRGLTINEVLKYLSYLFIWPGITAAKYVWLIFCFLPFALMMASLGNRLNKDHVFELGYWLGLCILLVVGLCLASHQDPRYYRYPLAVMAFTAVAGMHIILKDGFGVKNNSILIGIILFLALPGGKIVMHGEGGASRLPSLKTNLGVLTDKVHFQDVLEKHYPQNIIALRDYEQNRELAEKSAWYIINHPSNPSAFLLPIRPQVGLWQTTTISWSSYEDKQKIVEDLKKYGFARIMKMKEDKLVFESLDEFAKEAVQFNRYPDTIYYPYEMPPELTRTKL